MAVIGLLEQALSGTVVCNIGQIDKPTEAALNKLVSTGRLAKWRGYWHPIAGAPWGIGPAKTCWGLPEVRDQVFS